MEDIHEILLSEVRENRKEIKELRNDITGVKTKVIGISLFLGMIGGKLVAFFPFLK